MSRPSLGVVLVVMGNPGVRGDVRMSGFSSTASLDEVCRTLAATGQYREQTLRVNALRALGKYVEKNFKDASQAARWLTILNLRLGVWAAASCAREVLHLVPLAEQKPRIAVDTAEAWVRGEATREQTGEAATNAAANAARAATNAAANAAISVALAANTAAISVALAANAAARAAVWAANAAAWNAARDTELRRLVSVVVERLVLFPEWAGDPSDDRWPLPTKSKR